MSDFEFLSVLVSIVIGLGLTHMLAGLGRAMHFRRENRLDSVHIAWSLTVFLVLILNWWVFLLWRDFAHWNFASFATIILWTASMYMLALALYPPQLSGRVDYQAVFEANRSWFLTTFTLMCALDITVTAIRVQGMPELHYLAYVGHYGLISALGILVKRRKYDLAAAWYITLTLILWSFGVRATLF